MRMFFSLFAVAALASPGYAATANLVVMATNPNGAPAVGTQYKLGISVAGTSGPTFLGSNLITFSGAMANDTAPGAFAAQPANFYSGPNVLFQSEADLSNTIDAANYAKRNDSYFATPWKTLLPAPNGAGETANSMFIDGGVYGVLPSKVPGNGVYDFAYVNVTSAAGVEIHGMLAIGTDPAPIGNGSGLRLTLGGQLEFLVPPATIPGDYNDDGSVNAADYAIWRDKLGANFTLPGEKTGASTPGVVDQEDYAFWKSRFGAPAGSGAGSTAVIPEPASLSLSVLGLAIATGRAVRCRLADSSQR